MPGGALFGTMFFLLFIVSALTSSIAVMEPIVAWADEHRGMRRSITTPIVGLLAWLLGLTTVFSFNIWSDVYPLAAFETFAQVNLFGLQEYLAVNIMLPLGGLLIAVFIGWVMPRTDSTDELGMGDSRLYRVWRFLVRYVCPVAVAGILLSNWL
jgi:NSS family neurotransmitter:Na+ symporter